MITIDLGSILYWVAIIFAVVFGGCAVVCFFEAASKPVQLRTDYPLDRLLRRVRAYIKQRWGY